MDCLNVIWNSLCKLSGFKAVEASAKHYLPATREAPKIISRALQELHSQKTPGCRYVCWLASLKRERLATRDLKGPKIWLTLCKKSFALFVYRPCLCLASFIVLHESLQREELNHARLDRCATNFDARHFMTLQADRGYWKLRSLP